MRNLYFCLGFAILLLALFGCKNNIDTYHSSFSEVDSSKLDGYLVRTNSQIDIIEGVTFAQMLRDHATAERSIDDELRALHVLFELHFNNGKNDMALNVAQRAIDLVDTCTNNFLVARTYHFMGKYLARKRNATLASRNLSTSFKMFYALGDTVNVTAVFRDLILSYNMNGMFDSSTVSINRCMQHDVSINNKPGIAEDYAVSGDFYISRFGADLISRNPVFLDSAEYFFDKAVELNYQLPVYDLNVEEVVYRGYSLLYYYRAKYLDLPYNERIKFIDKAQFYHSKSRKYVKNLEDAESRRIFDQIGFDILIVKGNSEKITYFVDSIADIANRPEASYLDKEIDCRIKSMLYQRNGDFKSSLAMMEKANFYKSAYDSHNSSLAITVGIARGQYEGETARNRAMRMQMEGEAQALRGKLTTLIITALLLLVIGIIVIRNLRRTKKLNNDINQANNKLEQANKDISTKNKEVTESISYASIIQVAAMPSVSQMGDIFGESLILLKPRDIVSGDFFWASEKGDYKLLAVGDCTGHGVPGALLSMLGMSILDYTTRHFGENGGEISAGLALDRMRTYFKRTLNQNSFRTDKAFDSIDLALLVVDMAKGQIHYAAAFRPLVYFRDGELYRIKADPMPIGVYPKEREHFTNHVIDFQENDVFYLFSDGITDQSGYENGEQDIARAFSNKRFQTLLQDIYTLPFEVQKDRINDTISKWREPKSASQVYCEQTDDTIIIGISARNFLLS